MSDPTDVVEGRELTPEASVPPSTSGPFKEQIPYTVEPTFRLFVPKGGSRCTEKWDAGPTRRSHVRGSPEVEGSSSDPLSNEREVRG